MVKLATPMAWMAGAASIVLSLWGCGGQVTEEPPAGPETTAPVTLTFTSDTSGDSLNLSANKDASGFADTRLDGGDVGGIGNENIDIVCDLTFGHAERTGNALTAGTGIEVRDLNDPLVADCANPSKCITCQNEWKSWDDVALAWVADPSHSHCVGTCTGVVPANAATELDELEVYSHFYGTVTSDMPSVDLAALLYQGWIENWPTLDFSDVLDLPGTYEAVVLDATGDFTFSFLQDPFTTHGLPTRDVIEAAGWTRGIDLTALDPTPAAGVGSGEIHTQHLASMPFTGAASGSVNLSAGPLSVALTLCDDVNNCAASELSVSWYLRDAEDGIIANGAVGVSLPLDFVFGEAMAPNTLFNGNILITIPGAPPSLEQPNFSFLGVAGSGDTAFELLFNAGGAESYLYQGMTLQAAVTNKVLSASNAPAAASSLSFTLAASASDGFVGDTHDNYDFGKILPVDPWSQTEDSYQSAAPYVDFGSADWENRCLVYSDAAKDEIAIPQVSIWPTKDLVSHARSMIQIDLKDIANVKKIELGKDRDADLIGLRIADATTGEFLFLGVRAVRAADGGVMPICEVSFFDPSVNPPNRDDNPPIGDITHGSWRDCTGVANANFALQYDQERESLVAWMAENATATFSTWEQMDGANYNAYGADGDKELSIDVLPKGPDGASTIGVLFNSSAGNTRDLKASLVRIVTYGWSAEGISWEPVPSCGTPGEPCM